jgi:hypothetical protein
VSSAPKTSPAALPREAVAKIIDARVRSKRCAEVVQAMLKEEIGRYGLCIFIKKDVRTYVQHYNQERLHMGIGLKTPAQLLAK